MLPIIGKTYHFFDDGKISNSRHYLATCLDIIPFERFNDILFEKALVYDHASEECHICSKSLLEVWELNVLECPFLYASQTDFAIQVSCPEYDDNDIFFVRTIKNEWFSINIQNDWQSGLLDVSGEKFKTIINKESMIDISKLLYKVPSGTTIYSPIWGDGKLYKVNDGVINVKFNGENNHKHFDRYGRMSSSGECVIFPSKNCRDWHKFEVPIQKGDIIVMESLFNGQTATWFCVFNGVKECEQLHYHIGTTLKGEILLDSYYDLDSYSFIRHATEEECEAFTRMVNDSNYVWDEFTQKYVLKNETIIEPFTKVLVRNKEDEPWGVSEYGYQKDGKFICTNNQPFNFCLLYDDTTKYLIGKTIAQMVI